MSCTHCYYVAFEICSLNSTVQAPFPSTSGIEELSDGKSLFHSFYLLQYLYYHPDAMDVDSISGQAVVSNFSDVGTPFFCEDVMDVDL